MINVRVSGTGSYLPKKRETAEDFLAKGASQAFIDKSGVYEHRVIGDNETLTDMEAEAANIALKKAGLKPTYVELIIGITALSQEVNPQNVCLTQQKIGAINAASFEMDQSCCGAIPAMIVANNFIAMGQYNNVLLVASCNLTQVSDETDPSSFVVLGDGASAIVMDGHAGDKGIISFDMETKGRFFNNCGIKVKKNKVSKQKSSYFNSSLERLLFFIDYDKKNPSSALNRYLIKSVPASVKRALQKANLTTEDIDWFIPHQNVTPLSGKWIDLLKIPGKKVHITNHKYGNMSAANIWVNLDEALQEGKIKDNDIVVFAGQGSGFHVGSIVMRW